MEKKEDLSSSGTVNPQYTPIQFNPYFTPYTQQYPQTHLKKLFVGQIPKTYTEEDVKQIFSSTCQVFSAIIIKDKVTMEHRGCAFIYIDPAFADIVKEQYHNKYCCPKMINKLQVRDANPPQKLHMNTLYPPHPPSLPVVPPPTEQLPPTNPSASPRPSSNSNSSSPSVIQPPGVYPVPYYPIMPQNMLYPSMMVPVNTSSETAKEPVMTPVMAPYMVSYMPVPSENDPASAQPVYPYYQSDPSMPMMMPGGFIMPIQSYQGFTPTPNQVEEKRIETSPEANLFVFNLPQNYDDLRLKELFQPFGEIISTKVICEKGTNTSKGYGFVNFYNEADAKRAIRELNGKIVDKKKLTVQVKKPKS